jgi:hypothetical protein
MPRRQLYACERIGYFIHSFNSTRFQPRFCAALPGAANMADSQRVADTVNVLCVYLTDRGRLVTGVMLAC